MTYRKVLVATAAEGGLTAVTMSLNVASRFGAHLAAGFLRSQRIPTYTIGDGLIVPSVNVEDYRAKLNASNAQDSAAALEALTALAAQAGVEATWIEIDADDDEQLVTCARRCDLVVLPVSLRARSSQHTILAANVGMACGGPLLIVPEVALPEAFGRRILLAWKDSRESARAMRDALPFLKKAEEIHVLKVGPEGGAEDSLLQDFLVRHDCPVPRVTVDRSEDVETARLIRRQIDMVGADMIVLGLYGHSRFRELVLGGVSRWLLDHLPVPALVSH